MVFLNCESLNTNCDGIILALESFKNLDLKQSMVYKSMKTFSL